jgi:hypothetical protein
LIDAYTEDNECLVVNTCPETAVDRLSMLSWWKAVDPGEFKMGSKEYWKSSIYDPSVVPPSRNSESKTYLLTELYILRTISYGDYIIRSYIIRRFLYPTDYIVRSYILRRFTTGNPRDEPPPCCLIKG